MVRCFEEQAGLSAFEKSTVLTSTKNNLDADEIEKALLEQHRAMYLRTREAGSSGDQRMND